MKTLTDCLYDTIHHNHKSIESIAEEIGVSTSYLYNSARPDQEDNSTGTGCRFPLKKLIPLIRATGNCSTVDYIENALGRVAIPIPTPGKDTQEMCRIAMQTVKEFGDLMGEFNNSIADGKISTEERNRALKEGYEAIQSIANLLEAIKTAK